MSLGKRPRTENDSPLPPPPPSQPSSPSCSTSSSSSSILGAEDVGWKLEWSTEREEEAERNDAADEIGISIIKSRRRTRLKIVVTSPPCTFCLVGRGRLRCRRGGEATIHGFSIHPAATQNKNGKDDDDDDTETSSSSLFVDFDSPSWNSLVTVNVTAGMEEEHVELEIVAQDVTADRAAVAQPPDHAQPSFVRVLDPKDPKTRPTIIPASWKNAVDAILQAYDDNHNHAHQALLRPSSSLNNLAFDRDTLLLPEDDAEATVDPAHNNRMGFRVALAGAKSTGKSTCLRYLVNRFLSNNNNNNQHSSSSRRRVAVLDADCGQPELGPPGMVTLTVLTQPLLHTPHTHCPIRQYERALFFGSNTSQTDPTRYIACIQQLLAAYQDLNDPSLPLCINLDGWVKGLGGEVLQALMDALAPTHLIQLVGDNKSQQFDVTVDEAITKHHFAYSFNSKQEPGLAALSVVDPAAPESSSTSSTPASPPPPLPNPLAPPPPLSISAAALRSLRICSYFLQDAAVWDHDRGIRIAQKTGLVDPLCVIANTLAAARPYRVPLDAVEWMGCFAPGHHSCNNIRSESSMLDVLNGSIVGLCCRRNENDDDGANDRHCKTNTKEHHLLPCVGLGLIRAIDRVERLFYILTPVRADDLLHVNCLVRGTRILLPLECYYRGVQSEGFPYQSVDLGKLNVLGAEPMQSRNSIARKGLAQN